MIVLTIPEATPSLNLSMGRHWSYRKQERDRWGWLVRQALLNLRLPARPNWPRATITIERYGAKIIDADNCRAGTKWLVDSLVAEKIIVDDNSAVIGEPTLIQRIEKNKADRRTIVRIEGV